MDVIIKKQNTYKKYLKKIFVRNKNNRWNFCLAEHYKKFFFIKNISNIRPEGGRGAVASQGGDCRSAASFGGDCRSAASFGGEIFRDFGIKGHIGSVQYILLKKIEKSLYINKAVSKAKGGPVTRCGPTEIYVLKKISNVFLPDYIPVKCFDIQSLNNGYMHIYYNKSLFLEKQYMISLAADNFSNQTLINLIFSQIFLENNISPSLFVSQLCAYYQKTDNNFDGYSLMEFSHFDSIYTYIKTKKKIINVLEKNNVNSAAYKINEFFILNILKDISTCLSILKQPRYGFVHADMKPGNIFLAIDPIQNNYEKLINNFKLKFPKQKYEDNKNFEKYYRENIDYFNMFYNNSIKLKAQIADFDKSSISYNNVRFFNDIRLKNILDWRTLGKFLYSSVVGYDQIKCNDSKDGGYYILNETSSDPRIISGTAFHYKFSVPLSYDIYVFITGLVLIPGIFDIFMNSTHLVEIWNSLWYPTYLHKINFKISKTRKDYYGINDIIKILLDFPLKINISEFYKKAMGVSSLINPLFPSKLDKNVIVSKNDHLCLTSCKKNVCKTPPYNKAFFSTYSNDNC